MPFRSERVIDELLKMDKEDAENIFSSDKLRVESEDSLFEVITLLGPDYYFLFDYVEMQYLSVQNVAKLIENIDNCDIPFHTLLWKSICRRLVRELESNSSFKNPREKRPINCENGVFRYIRENSNRKEYPSKEFDAFASSIYSGEIKNLFDQTKKTQLLTNNDDNTFVMIDFKDKKINLTKYYLSVPSSYSGNRPKSWEIQGSNNNEEWEVLDKKQNCSNLSSDESYNTFTCQNVNKQYYRYIRIANITNKDNNHSLVLSEIELYGSVITE